MTYKHFYKALLIRILAIVFLSASTTFFAFKKDLNIFSILSALLLIASIVEILRYFSRINKLISFFLQGIENKDTMLKIPAKTGNKSIDEIFDGLERLNSFFKQNKIEINSQEQYFNAIISKSSTGLFSVNTDGRILNINSAAVKFTNLNISFHISSLSAINQKLPAFILNYNANNTKDSEVFVNKDGLKLLFKISEISTTKGIVKLIAISDITKELDNREVDTWIKLASTLSHEILNNITPITTLSQVLYKYFVQNNTTVDINNIEQKTIQNTVKGLRVIEEQSLVLMNFVNNYRKFTKLPEPNISNVNISLLLENNIIAVSSLQNFKNINLRKDIPQNIFFNTDEKLLSQVIINILKNASEALINKLAEGIIELNIRNFNKSIRIEISNNGNKIKDEVLEHIFIPFYTTKVDGSGIGLSLSKQILLQMNGDIFLKSTSDEKTTFVVILN